MQKETIKKAGLDIFISAADSNPKLFKKYIIIGAFHIQNGIRDFSEWSNIMVDGEGEEIKPYLKEIWEKIKQDYNKLVPEMKDSTDIDEFYKSHKCFCPTCLEESLPESTGNLDMLNFIGTGLFYMGHRCKICNSFIAKKCYSIFIPVISYGNYRIIELGTNSSFWGTKTKHLSRKLKNQSKYKLFRWRT